ncbi:hypothetical protein [Cellulomonas sp. URHE0023]|uniref:hypothetical protein n=1 Tax=Cellulomonas sp. URHE0023 TaxID=1380354 RepID=UPI0005561EB0|nr:hypothetical protein [Cellulomonas sp. URHE0023]
MTRPRPRDGWVIGLCVVSAFVALATVLVYRVQLDQTPGTVLALTLLVVAGAVAAACRPRRAARHAWLFVVPATLATWLWEVAGPATPSYDVLTVTVTDASSPASTPAIYQSPDAAVFGQSTGPVPIFTALVVLLWAVTTVGLVVLVRDARPESGAAHVLAVVAAVLTAPQVHQLATRHLLLAGSDVFESTGSATAEAVAVALVVGIGAAVVRSHRRVPARSSLYLLPAAMLTWLAWTSGLGPEPVYGSFAYGGSVQLTWLDTLPWTAIAAFAACLLVVVWIQAVRGTWSMLVRYRPPPALEEPLVP